MAQPPVQPHRLACAALLAFVLAPDAAHAQDAPADTAAMLRDLGNRLKAQEEEIARLRRQLEDVQLEQMRGRGPAAQAAGATPAPQPQVAAHPASPAPPDAPLRIGEAQRADDAERREREKALVVREHAPLFERRFTLDTGLSYAYYDRRQLALSGFLALDAIFLGRLNLDQSKATIATFDVTGRYGISDRISLEATVPFVWRDTRFVSGGAGGAASALSEVDLQGSGLGDVSVAAYYQLVKESAKWPDVVASVRVRAPTGREPFGLKIVQPDGDNTNLNVPESMPTGSGVWSTSANVSVLRTYDPVILFGNLGYTHNFARDFDDISPILGTIVPARVELGHVIQLSGGVAIALNDRSAVSFSVATALQSATHTLAEPTEGEDPPALYRVPGSSSNSTALNIGASYLLPSGWTFNGQLAAGLTPDAPNFVFALRTSKAF